MNVFSTKHEKEGTMKETADESAKLKRRFKDHFAKHGYHAVLSPELDKERAAFPLEWGEACEEYERWGS
jgi:hypothetical protein